MKIDDLHGARVVKINSSNQIYLPKKLNYQENDILFVKRSNNKKRIILVPYNEFKHEQEVFEKNMAIKKRAGIIDSKEYRRLKRQFHSKTFVDQVEVDRYGRVVLSKKYADAEMYFAKPKNYKKNNNKNHINRRR